MARKTFGRAGHVIVVPASGDSEPISISEAELDGEPVRIDADGRVEIIGSADNGDADSSGADFVAVGDVIRTQPISDPGSGAGYSDPANATGKRPRKPRGPNKPKVQTENSSVVISAQLDAILFGLHTMAATWMHEPELAITEDESKVLAEAIEKMAKAYNFSAMLSPKTSAAVDLCIALGTVYGPRVMSIARKPRKVERNVTPIDKAAQ